MQRPGGRRRAGSDEQAAPSGRRTLLRRLPTMQTLVGVSVLVLATAGSLGVGTPNSSTSRLDAHHQPTYVAHASALTGSSGVSSTTLSDRRDRSVSRDTQREALKDAADQNVRQAHEAQAKESNAALAAVAASAEKQAGLLAKDAWQLPVTAGAYHLTARFGECSAHWAHCHTGLDFAAPEGTPIHAVANGTVTKRGLAGAYGNRTIVTLEDGTELWFCHQSTYAVRPGQKVTAGQVIGAVGSTGNTTGPHVHVEVRPGAGDPVDPYTAMIAHGLRP